MSGQIVCPCCYATTFGTAPHGKEPCPTAIALHGATMHEQEARAALLEAQREATIASAGKTRR
jgi:hypothetical protein